MAVRYFYAVQRVDDVLHRLAIEYPRLMPHPLVRRFCDYYERLLCEREMDTTEAEFDAMAAEGEPCLVVGVAPAD